MSLKEQAQKLKDKTDSIEFKNREITDLCHRVLEQHDLDGEIIEWSAKKKQKFINYSKKLIAELKKLVEELP